MQPTQNFDVKTADQGKRLDKFLFEKEIALSRSQIKKMIENNLVKIDGKAPKSSSKLKTGQTISVFPQVVDGKSLLEREEIQLDIVYEDSSIIVVNKPAGMVVHPAPGHRSGTLVNAILGKVKDMKPIMGEMRPGIVHRLDKETSGVMVVAKNKKSLLNLAGQFKNRTVEKSYRAIVLGEFSEDSAVSEKLIGRSRHDRKKMAAMETDGRPALTYFKVLERFKGLTFVEANPRTGRTHQIRVHLANMGFPVIGDKLYLKGRRLNDIKSKSLRKILGEFSRQALHALSISFIHPEKNERVRFQTELPEDMENLLGYLRTSR